jgi:5'-nucleotidase
MGYRLPTLWMVWVLGVAACADDDESDDLSAVVIGEITVPLDVRKVAVRTREAPIGNLVADAILEAHPEADLALLNGGNLRHDEETRPDGLYPAGPWSEAMLRELLRFDFQPGLDNPLALITVTGAQLKDALERSVANINELEPDPDDSPQSRGWFLHVAGATYRADLSRQAQVVSEGFEEVLVAGDRIVEMTVGGVAVTPEATYRVVTIAFLAEGQDGHISLRDGTERMVLVGSSADATRAYLMAHSPVTPAVEGRIVIEKTAE